MPRKLLFVFLFIALVPFSACERIDKGEKPPSSKKIQVTASFSVLAHFAKITGGDFVEVTSLVPPTVEPHDYELKPSDVDTLLESNLLVAIGEGFEPWLKDLRPEFDERKVETELILNYLKKRFPEQKENFSEDPHVWLDPILVKEIVRLFTQAFQKIDPDSVAMYLTLNKSYIAELEKLDADLRSAFQNCRLKEAVSLHQAFDYLGRQYGISFVTILGKNPEEEPSIKHIKDVSDFVKEKKIQYILGEPGVETSLIKVVADETGAEILTLDSIERFTSDTYISKMRNNIGVLKKALECQ